MFYENLSNVHFDTILDQSLKEILENKEMLEFLDSQCIDESKRLNKSRNLENIYGLEGNFKKLDID